MCVHVNKLMYRACQGLGGTNVLFQAPCTTCQIHFLLAYPSSLIVGYAMCTCGGMQLCWPFKKHFIALDRNKQNCDWLRKAGYKWRSLAGINFNI